MLAAEPRATSGAVSPTTVCEDDLARCPGMAGFEFPRMVLPWMKCMAILGATRMTCDSLDEKRRGE